MKNNLQWWHNCPLVKRYMPEEEQISIADILCELDQLAAYGYGAIHITAPYKSAGPYPWWGLRPLDYFALNETLGTNMEDFKKLVRECHKKGLYVMIFLNLGYADVLSDLWKKACIGKRNRAKRSEADFFLWSDTGEDPLPITGNQYFKQSGRWVFSPEADAYYWSYWKDDYTYVNGKILEEPQYNWASPSWRKYAVQVLNFWLDTGIDGVIVDAVNWYLNCDFSTMRRCITDVIHKRPGVFCIPEGGSGFLDNPMGWLRYGHFDIIDDQSFHSELTWNGSAIMDAIRTGSASELQKRLKNSEKVRKAGCENWSYLTYSKTDDYGNPIEWIPKYRLLEIAVLLGTGHIVDIINTYLAGFSFEEKKQLYELFQMAKHLGLAPQESLRFLKSKDPACFLCLRSEKHFPVLCIYNFSEQIIYIPVSDLNRQLMRYSGAGLNDLNQIRLLPYSYRFLEI